SLRGTTGTAALQRCAGVAGAVPAPTPVRLGFAGIAHILPQQSANHAVSLPIVPLVRQPLGDCQGPPRHIAAGPNALHNAIASAALAIAATVARLLRITPLVWPHGRPIAMDESTQESPL